jgi:NDP-sugar pyrophosphorylase family protein
MDTGEGMKAMVLSAGFGTRLGDLTREIPKGMLMVGEYPILAWLIANLVRCGISDLAMNLHFQPEIIRSYFGDGSRFGVRLRYSYEERLLGTAGGTGRLAEFFRDGAFLVHYGDILTDQDLEGMRCFHAERKASITLLLHERQGSNSVVEMNDSQRVERFLERPSADERAGVTSSWVNSGVCICSPEVLDLIPAGRPVDFPRDVFPKLIAAGTVYGYPLTGYRCAIDSAERLAAARKAVTEGLLKTNPAAIDQCRRQDDE